MNYYLWPIRDEKKLRYLLFAGKLDLRERTPFRKVMSRGDVAYFCLGRGRGVVARATLAGKPYPLSANELKDREFPLAVNLKDIRYIDPPVKTTCPRGVRKLPAPLLEPEPTRETTKLPAGLIQADPAIMMGKPVVAGTRITVELILEKLAAGETVEQVLAAHPRLTEEAVRAALTFAHQALRADVIYPIAGTNK